MTPAHHEPKKIRSRPALLPAGRSALLGLGVLVIAGAVLPVSHSVRLAGLSSTSAAAAEAVAPPAPAMPSFANLAARLKPAVVSVYVDAEIGGAQKSFGEQGEGQSPFDQNSPFDFFFHQFGEPKMPAQRVRAQGSGFFISPDGYVLTNNHVIQHAKRVQIKTVEGKSLSARIVGADAKTDLAVLKVEGSGHPAVTFASTPPRVGDWVLAMGNPYGLGGTVTAGIVSASGRDIGSGSYNDFLQIDAPVNKGNSGGPTFNMQGEVVGINTAIYSPSGGSVGIAFDIPADAAKTIADQLKTKGVINRGWIGVMVQPVTADIADSLGLKEPKGALVDDVQRNSPAARSGLHSGDLVLAVDGVEIKDARDLARKIAEVAPGTSLKLQIRRNGSEEMVTVAAAQYPNEQAKAETSEPANRTDTKLGLYVAPANEVEGAGSQGVVIVSIDPNGTAAEKGLQQGDVILDAGGKTVSAPADLATAVSEAREAGKHSILMRIKTAENTRYVAMPLNSQGG
jgi:serine protease Do